MTGDSAWRPIASRPTEGGGTEVLVRYDDDRPDEWRPARVSVEATVTSPDGARRDLGEVASSNGRVAS